MTGDIEWGAPPPPSNGMFARSKWWDKLDQLKTRPGQWAVIANNEPISTFARFRKHGFEFTSRGTSGTQSRADKVYGRFIGLNGEYRV